MKFSFEGNVKKNNSEDCVSGGDKETGLGKKYGRQIEKDIVEFGPRTVAERRDLKNILYKVLSDKKN